MSPDRNVQKKNAGYRAAGYVEDDMVVGLGTGSTAKFAIEKIGERIEDKGLDVVGIPTSIETEKRAERAGIEEPYTEKCLKTPEGKRHFRDGIKLEMKSRTFTELQSKVGSVRAAGYACTRLLGCQLFVGGMFENPHPDEG
ncbi:MAG: hypothetical protein ACLFNY_06380 [Candidatus Aenigmatarchaeota archaeon]